MGRLRLLVRLPRRRNHQLRLRSRHVERERGRGRRGRSRTTLGDTLRKTTTSQGCQHPRGRHPVRVRRTYLHLRSSGNVERGADRGRVRVRECREERLSRLRPAESCSGSFFSSRQIRHSTLHQKPATIAGRWATPACGVHGRPASFATIVGGVVQTLPSVRGAGWPTGLILRAGTADGCPHRNARATWPWRYPHREGVPPRTLPRGPKRRWCELDGLERDLVHRCPRVGK